MSELITLKNGKTFLAEKHQTLLDAALSSDLVLEYSCKTGRCGVCKTMVDSGDTQVIKNQECLSELEIKEGYILTCCRAAQSDVKLATEDLGELAMLKLKTIPCRINSLTKLSHDVIEVVLRTPPANVLEYLPGQYIEIIANRGVRRSYSIANAPRNSGLITLHIRKIKNGLLSKYWFNEAKINDLLRLEGALGTFFLRESKSKNLIFMATGTGIAPIKAILENLTLNQQKYDFESIYLYWGGRVKDDLYWQPNLQNLPITYKPVLSQDKTWPGHQGHIQQALIKDNINLAESVVYACGSEAMIHGAKTQLCQVGLAENNFYFDAFISSN